MVQKSILKSGFADPDIAAFLEASFGVRITLVLRPPSGGVPAQNSKWWRNSQDFFGLRSFEQGQVVGQPAVLRFSAFNQRTTPEINGSVVRISGDIILDQKSGATYYLVHIATPMEEIVRLEGLKLVPGMPVEAFIQTEARTVLSYLIKPLHDQILKAFRER